MLCVPTKVALKLGLSHVPLADAALDALESWAAHIPPETMQPCYSSVLPLLDGYLKSHLNHSKNQPLLYSEPNQRSGKRRRTCCCFQTKMTASGR